jgi:hypothetical protein
MRRHRPVIAAFAALMCGSATAQTASLPATTLACANFQKQADGAWTVLSEKPFTIGDTTVSINQGTIIRPRSVNLVGVDFYSLLEAHCHRPG